MNYDYCYFISKAGELPADRLQRKCSQLQGLVLPLQKIATKRCSSPHRSKISLEENKFSSEVGRRCIIVDFCSGGGHLGLLLAHLIPQVRPIDFILRVSTVECLYIIVKNHRVWLGHGQCLFLLSFQLKLLSFFSSLNSLKIAGVFREL